MRISFERATIKDVETLVSFERKVADPALYGPLLDASRATEEIERNIFVFVKAGATIIGTGAYRFRPDESVYVCNVAVSPQFRRKGVARAIIQYILEECKNAPRVDLVTHPENENALRLYNSLGFKVKSRKENYFGDGEPRLVLVLSRCTWSGQRA